MKKWLFQDNIVGDICLNVFQMNELGIFFDNVLVIVFKVILDEKDSLNIRLEIEFIGKFFSFFFFLVKILVF